MVCSHLSQYLHLNNLLWSLSHTWRTQNLWDLQTGENWGASPYLKDISCDSLKIVRHIKKKFDTSLQFRSGSADLRLVADMLAALRLQLLMQQKNKAFFKILKAYFNFYYFFLCKRKSAWNPVVELKHPWIPPPLPLENDSKSWSKYCFP